MFRTSAARFASASMIVLALLAPLPQSFCCCGFSAGPLGLVANIMRCDLPLRQKCCSCPKCAHQETQQSHGFRTTTAKCTFSLVSAAPLSHSPSVDVDQLAVMHLAPLLDITEHVAPYDAATAVRLRSDRAILSSPDRCALLQSWRV